MQPPEIPLPTNPWLQWLLVIGVPYLAQLLKARGVKLPFLDMLLKFFLPGPAPAPTLTPVTPAVEPAPTGLLDRILKRLDDLFERLPKTPAAMLVIMCLLAGEAAGGEALAPVRHCRVDLAMTAWDGASAKPQAALPAVPMPLVEQTGDLSGYYTCKGAEASGKEYRGIVSIERRGEAYMVNWLVGGGPSISGIGVRQGDTFAVSWALQGPRGIAGGVNVYRVEKGPRLVGRWTSELTPPVLMSETLTWLKEMEEEP